MLPEYIAGPHLLFALPCLLYLPGEVGSLPPLNPLPRPRGVCPPSYLVLGETNHRGHLPATFRICSAAERIAIQGCFSFAACRTNCVCSPTMKQEERIRQRMGTKRCCAGLLMAGLVPKCLLLQ
ncbi:hypothetical protein CEXT_95181 [Caerostris extrusa]|uniref:Secreted protein n=1 Tax=Caerostris extrusa TaxID=172846 RepID=A0AAV4PCZ3_CAEEX|nr:hypothetical protein CEXT_95181 [Caerostris extrusa]